MTVLLVGIALIVGFALGAILGFGSYHLGRMTNKYLPIYKAQDNEKKQTAALAAATKMQKEIADLQTAYLGGIHLTRDQYLAAEAKK